MGNLYRSSFMSSLSQTLRREWPGANQPGKEERMIGSIRAFQAWQNIDEWPCTISKYILWHKHYIDIFFLHFLPVSPPHSMVRATHHVDAHPNGACEASAEMWIDDRIACRCILNSCVLKNFWHLLDIRNLLNKNEEHLLNPYLEKWRISARLVTFSEFSDSFSPLVRLNQMGNSQ